MKTRSLAAAALAVSAATAQAGGIDRSSQFLGPLFEEGGDTGTHVQLSLGKVSPSAKAGNLNVTNPLGEYASISFAFKTNITEKLSAALILEEPYGADIRYAVDSVFAGGGASVNSNQISLLFRYKFTENWSAIAGVRSLNVDGFIDTFTANPFPFGPAVIPVSVNAESDRAYGAVIGAAYEIPDIALRVALSYNESMDADFTGTQTFFGDAARTAILDQSATQFTVAFPESINLEFQTGVAPGTLLFGSVRRSYYDGFSLTTPASTTTTPIAVPVDSIQFVNFANDTTTYNIGVGRQFNEKWSGSVSFTYERAGVTPSTTALAPTTGTRAIALGGRYSGENYTISGGISYVIPGDQLVNSAVGQANFDDNSAIAVGFRVGFDF